MGGFRCLTGLAPGSVGPCQARTPTAIVELLEASGHEVGALTGQLAHAPGDCAT